MIRKSGSFYPETPDCHSEPFGKTCRPAQVASLRAGSAKKATLCHPEPFDGLRIDSVKDLEILRRPAAGGTPQNDMQEHGFRMDTR
jgi:hypothetical protein